MALNENKSGDSSLRDWFGKSKSSDGKPGWVQLGGKYAGKPCAKQPGQTTKPKCGSSKMKRALSKDEEEAAFRRKNREDPNPDRKGKAINVKTEETNMTIDSSAHKVKQRREKMRALMQRGVGGERDAAKRKLGKTAELPKLNKEEALDEKCWKGYTAKGLKKKGNRMVPNCVPVGEEAIEERSLSKGEEKDKEKYVKGMKKSAKDFKARYGDDYKSVMYATATKMAKDDVTEGLSSDVEVPSNGLKKLVKRAVKRIDTNVSGDVDKKDKSMGEFGEFVPSPDGKKKITTKIGESLLSPSELLGEKCWKGYEKKGMKTMFGKRYPNCVKKEEAECVHTKKGKECPVHGMDSCPDEVNEAAAWTRKAGKNKSGGLNEKGRKSYERENPGSDLKAPSKKVGNPRRASFCARMKGMKKKLTSSKTANDPDSRINKSLRAWNC